MGGGKTSLMREFAKNILVNGKPPKYLEVNCGTIKSAAQFFDKVWNPYMLDKDAILALDEFHTIPDCLSTIFLTMFNTEKSHIRTVKLADSEIQIDFSRQIVMAGTTEPDRVFKPLRSRFECLSVAPYSKEDLIKIIQLNLPNISFQDGCLEEIVETIRGTPRSAVLLSRKIEDYCSIYEQKKFKSTDFVNLQKMANIKRFGLNEIEISILKALEERGSMSLTEISATLDISATAIRREHEHFPIKKGFIRICGKREITQRGRDIIRVLKTVELTK